MVGPARCWSRARILRCTSVPAKPSGRRPVGQIGLSELPAGRAKESVRLGARLALFDPQVPRFRSAACRSSLSSSSLVWPHCAIVAVARVPCCSGLLIQQTTEGSVDSMRPDRPGPSVHLGCWARGRASVGASCGGCGGCGAALAGPGRPARRSGPKVGPGNVVSAPGHLLPRRVPGTAAGTTLRAVDSV